VLGKLGQAVAIAERIAKSAGLGGAQAGRIIGVGKADDRPEVFPGKEPELEVRLVSDPLPERFQVFQPAFEKFVIQPQAHQALARLLIDCVPGIADPQHHTQAGLIGAAHQAEQTRDAGLVQAAGARIRCKARPRHDQHHGIEAVLDDSREILVHARFKIGVPEIDRPGCPKPVHRPEIDFRRRNCATRRGRGLRPCSDIPIALQQQQTQHKGRER